MIINHNLNSMNACRNIGIVTNKQGKAMEKLSSGLRINRASDDAAGLAISEKMRSQIRGLNQASRNAQDGISMIQTAEGALSETHAISQRMRELAVQSSNGTYTDEDRDLINQEFVQLKKEIDRVARDTEFSGGKVLNGDKSGRKIEYADGKLGKIVVNGTVGQKDVINTLLETKNEDVAPFGEGSFSIKITANNDDMTIEITDKSKFNGYKEYVMDSCTVKNALLTDDTTVFKFHDGQIKMSKLKAVIKGGSFSEINIDFENSGDKVDDGVKLQVGANKEQLIGFSIENMRSRELGLGGIVINTIEDAQDAIGRVDKAISKISAQRADLGAVQNRLEHTIASTDNTAENLQAAESRIRDVDMAKETMNLTKLNVLQQASQAMLSQANQAPQQVMSMLK